MPKYKPLNYKDVIKILKNLGFSQDVSGSTSHQTWVLKRKDKFYAVTLSFHGYNKDFKRGTLSSIVRQSGFTKDQLYRALKKREKHG